MRWTALVILCMFLCCACRFVHNKLNGFSYVPLAEYSYVPAHLKNGTELRLLAFSGGRESDKEHIYYYQFLALNEASGDTVRVLVPAISVDKEVGVPDKTFSSPLQFKAEKNVTHATFEVKDSSTEFLMQTMAGLQGVTEADTASIVKMVQDRQTGQTKTAEFVVVNAGIPELNDTRYKTSVGTLNFKQIPW